MHSIHLEMHSLHGFNKSAPGCAQAQDELKSFI